jgi:Flp pilus assembly pilin Flp
MRMARIIRFGSMKNPLLLFVGNESGVTAIDLIAGLISIVIIGAASAIGTQLAVVFTGISAVLAGP